MILGHSQGGRKQLSLTPGEGLLEPTSDHVAACVFQLSGAPLFYLPLEVMISYIFRTLKYQHVTLDSPESPAVGIFCNSAAEPDRTDGFWETVH